MKRTFDFVISIAILVACSPLFFIIAVCILFTMGRPIFFKQLRAGKDNELFYIYKFRTMINIVEMNGRLLNDEERLTKLGAFLRKTSLDELPQLINVLKGEMSLVGPRPLLPEYLSLYTKEQLRRHEVRPGMTGLAQVSGRNCISWEEKFRLDVWYVDHCSFWLDIKILFLTLVKVWKREGISQPGKATVEKFKGMGG